VLWWEFGSWLDVVRAIRSVERGLRERAGLDEVKSERDSASRMTVGSTYQELRSGGDARFLVVGTAHYLKQ
jgi:hypothetical protein